MRLKPPTRPSQSESTVTRSEMYQVQPECRLLAATSKVSPLAPGHWSRDCNRRKLTSLLKVFPDHLGNNQRLFDKYGPIFKENTMGSVVCQTNDPELASIAFAESEFFSKEIGPNHPLLPIKNDAAGVFLGDTSNPNWKIVHKYMPPALGPKAVRHYAPQMNSCCEESYPVFDDLEEQGEAWNVYQYMLKLSSGTVGKIVMGKDLQHFTSTDAPLHKIVLAIAESLAINKKIASRGAWYSHLPFGDPARLKNLQSYMADEILQAIKEAKSNGDEDLPLQDAALKAANVIGMYGPHCWHSCR